MAKIIDRSTKHKNMLVIKIDTDNAAYKDPVNGEFDKDFRAHELAVNLKSIATKLLNGKVEGYVLDSNGNSVGTWIINES